MNLAKLTLIFTMMLTVACGDDIDGEELSNIEQKINDDSVQSQNKCGTEGDQFEMYATNHNFAEAWYKKSNYNGMDVSAMHHTYSQMTRDCLECFNHMTKCSVRNCKMACFSDGRSQGCHDCSVRHCGDQMFKCSGVPAEDLPDFRRN